MKKYADYTKEQLLEVISEKNKTIAKLNGQVYYYKGTAKYHKNKYKQEKRKNENRKNNNL